MSRSTRRSFRVPEVIQSSAMDCGPAALKAVLEGFGIPADYGRLREACNTDVDGTSIDTIEDVLVELGLDAEQIMVPRDFLLLADADLLPAIVVLRRKHEAAHFVVAWRKVAGFVEVMDPAVGRRWVRSADFLMDVYQHEMNVPSQDWHAWAASPKLQKPLSNRIAGLGVGPRNRERLLERARAAEGWEALATLDAASRMLHTLSAHQKLGSARDRERLLTSLSTDGIHGKRIPDLFWSVRPPKDGQDSNEVTVRGAVLVRIGGRLPRSSTPVKTQAGAALAPDLLLALKTPQQKPWRPFLDAVREMGIGAGVCVAGGILVAAGTVLIQALLLRSLLDVGYWLGTGEHRLGAFVVLAVCLAAVASLEYPLSLAISRLGRRLDVLLRLAFSRKIPRIADRYFHSRLVSDMAERLHAISIVRTLPSFVAGWMRAAFGLLFTSAGLIWLAPDLWLWTVASVAASFLLAMASLGLLQEREMRARSYGATLVRFYLDALLGTASVRAHDAGSTVLREQESLLVNWNRAQFRVQGLAIGFEAAQQLVTALLAVGLVMSHIAEHGTTASILLVTYWALQIPSLAQSLAASSRQVPTIRNVMSRVLEPLGAEEEVTGSTDGPAPVPARSAAADAYEQEAPQKRGGSALVAPQRRTGVLVELTDVTVRSGGHPVLRDLNLRIGPGEQVAVVGESGAGKSTLVGLLLGWYRAGTGSVLLDGEPLSPETLARWRARTAWVDPAVQLFNRRFAENVLYGAEENVLEMPFAIEQADLREVIERLPEGLQTQMGEGGALVSGGEGQRVRLGRALLRRDVSLVLLDEPFRGLDREKRRSLLGRARKHWSGATLVCVTHDVSDTLEFERVLVIESGRVVEDGDPRALACEMGSRYQTMLASEQFVRERLWASPAWKRFRVEGGAVIRQEERDWVEAPLLVAGEVEPVVEEDR